jgi:hypothetical protein
MMRGEVLAQQVYRILRAEGDGAGLSGMEEGRFCYVEGGAAGTFFVVVIW